MNKTEFIEELLSELSYRSDEGYPILTKSTHINLISEILDEWGMTEIKNILIENLLEDESNPEDDKYTSTGGKGYVKSADWNEYQKDKDGFTGEKFTKDANGKYVVQNSDGNSAEEDEQTPSTFDASTPDGLEYIKSLGPNDAAYQAAVKAGHIKDTDTDDDTEAGDDDRVLPKVMNSNELGKVISETGDSDVKNKMMDVGYGGFEKETGGKPAPGGPGSAFNEIVSGELALILEKFPDMTEDELADYSHKRFGNTALGREQKETKTLAKNPDLEKRRNAAAGTGSHTKPQFPAQHKQVEKERGTYSKSRVAAASAIQKHKATQQRIKNLQSNKLFGTETKTHPFYGASVSIDSQVDMVTNANGNVYLPDGTGVDKDDLIRFIKAGGGGMNPSDTATFVTDENGNLLVQFHSDKTKTSDIQDNSTLAFEEVNYNSYIEKSSLSDEDKVKCKEINKDYSARMSAIEAKYNDQSVPIANKLLQLDKNKISKILDEDEGTMVQNVNDALYGEKARKKGAFTKINKKWNKYLPKGVKPEDLTNLQKTEMLYKYANDDGKLTAALVKSITKVGLQYKEENPDTIGLDVNKILSSQRKEVVEMQREKIRTMNSFTTDVDGVSVGAGTLMEAEENIRGFHLTLMDYPPKEYTKGDPSSITGTSLDINMGGVVVNGEVLRGCLGVENTTEFKQKFKLVEEEKLTYDSKDKDEDGNYTGNVTGKKVFTYVVDGKGGRKEIGFKSYRSKEGASGKTNNTMTYSTEMQNCFKSK
tara:strand:+ start:1044 stop:3332 length:2289 start_codon:yes stop_codon:yes gene_type:complete